MDVTGTNIKKTMREINISDTDVMFFLEYTCRLLEHKGKNLTADHIRAVFYGLAANPRDSKEPGQVEGIKPSAAKQPHDESSESTFSNQRGVDWVTRLHLSRTKDPYFRDNDGYPNY